MVSVIIPVYNVENYLEECLESLLKQTYKETEIIIIDDGSTDKSMEIIKSYSKKFNKFNLISQENSGVAQVRNIGLSKATGEYVLFVDSDDFLEPSMIEAMYNKAVYNRSDIVICDYYIYYDANKKIIAKYYCSDSAYSGDEIIKMMIEFKIQGQLWNKMFKRETLIKNNFQFENGRIIEDIFPVFKLIENCSNITFINKPLYYYRQRNDSYVYNVNKKLLDDYYYAMSNVMSYIEKRYSYIEKESTNIFRSNVLAMLICNYIKFVGTKKENKEINSYIKKFDVSFKILRGIKNISNVNKIKTILWKLKFSEIFKYFYHRKIIREKKKNRKADLRYVIYADIFRNCGGYSRLEVIKALAVPTSRPTVNFIIMMRIHKYFYDGTDIISMLLSKLTSFKLKKLGIKYGIEIPGNCNIGEGLRIPHCGGIVIHYNTVIGKKCEILQGVTIGNNMLRDYSEVATIGDNVFIGAGAKIIGKVAIGDNVTIGANSVVIKDIPSGAVVGGNPAKILSFKNSFVVNGNYLSKSQFKTQSKKLCIKNKEID